MAKSVLPAYKLLSSNFPTPAAKSTKSLLDDLGGQLRSEFTDEVNTCAMRVSVSLNDSGALIQKRDGLVT